MSFTVHRRFTAPLVLITVAGLALAGCSADGGSDSGPGDAGDVAERAHASPFAYEWTEHSIVTVEPVPQQSCPPLC